jgi:hypothetical protein
VDNDARMKIHKEEGTKKLFEWYLDMEKVVQLETLAALVCPLPFLLHDPSPPSLCRR